jgi:ppGpp synthetase/RelA/SpoT-type nucleotidyltranferase
MSVIKFDRASITADFERRQPTFNRLRDESLFILEQGLASVGIKFHSIPNRIKKMESFLDKLERKTDSPESIDPFTEVTDIVGLRVVCLFLSDIKKVGEIIRRDFDVKAEDNKIVGGDVSSFGYMSHHFVAAIGKSCAGPRYNGLHGMLFEIQVRTIAMDAWAAISHHLSYKSDVDVPAELKRDFHALSGLFYVADSHFEMFFKQRERGRAEIAKVLKTGKVNQELNLDTITEYLSSKFADRRQNDPSSISELVSEMHRVGYKTLDQLDDAIDRGYEAFLAYEKKYRPQVEKAFAAVGVVRVLLRIVDPTFRRLVPSSTNYGPYEAMVKKPGRH